MLRVLNASRDAVLGTRVGLADGWWSRTRGLLGERSLPEGGGLLLTRCRSVHMYGMRFSIDVAFVSRDGTVVETYPGLAPGRRTRWHRAARHALELPAGTIAATGTCPGDRLTWAPEPSPTAQPSPAATARAV
jgi:uncharacterized membrane protein (UPF0127 family)